MGITSSFVCFAMVCVATSITFPSISNGPRPGMPSQGPGGSQLAKVGFGTKSLDRDFGDHV